MACPVRYLVLLLERWVQTAEAHRYREQEFRDASDSILGLVVAVSVVVRMRHTYCHGDVRVYLTDYRHPLSSCRRLRARHQRYLPLRFWYRMLNDGLCRSLLRYSSMGSNASARRPGWDRIDLLVRLPVIVLA